MHAHPWARQTPNLLRNLVDAQVDGFVVWNLTQPKKQVCFLNEPIIESCEAAFSYQLGSAFAVYRGKEIQQPDR